MGFRGFLFPFGYIVGCLRVRDIGAACSLRWRRVCAVPLIPTLVNKSTVKRVSRGGFYSPIEFRIHD